ncbi:MAG: hypothetical protein IKE91_07840 [Clostridia bacterium]|nr:hypothetical protein [Clostridia bacterium]
MLVKDSESRAGDNREALKKQAERFEGFDNSDGRSPIDRFAREIAASKRRLEGFYGRKYGS